jgi:hypothetical protein
LDAQKPHCVLARAHRGRIPKQLENVVGKCGLDVENNQISGETIINMLLISGGGVFPKPVDFSYIAIAHARRERTASSDV